MAKVSLPALNLWLQSILVLLLSVGAILARSHRYSLHRALQTTIVLANALLIAWIMGPSFHRQLLPDFFGNFGSRHYAIAAIHAIVGGIAFLAATYVVLSAGTPFLTPRLRFTRFKPWMRAALVLWWAAFLLGAATYLLWYRFGG